MKSLVLLAATHGMLLFGTQKTYLSHLPMFHPPHDYQVILQVELSDDAKKKYLKSLQSSNETVYTILPEPFVLPEMVKSPHPFKADLYKGHFERGGTVIATQVMVKISQVIYFKKLNAQDSKPAQEKFLPVGTTPEKFLFHVITGKPDFDQILFVSETGDKKSLYFETGDLSM